MLLNFNVYIMIYDTLQVLVGSVVQVLLCIASSFFLLQFHKDLGKFELVLCSSAFGFNGLLFTIDAIIMFQQVVFSRSR